MVTSWDLIGVYGDLMGVFTDSNEAQWWDVFNFFYWTGLILQHTMIVDWLPSCKPWMDSVKWLIPGKLMGFYGDFMGINGI